MRDPKFKRSSPPKDITTIINGADSVHIFEGFMDFLSWKTLHPKVSENAFDFIILNGAGMFERARRALAKYEVKHLWLDRDATGMGYTKYALTLNEGFIDESGLYQDCKDLNDHLRLKLQDAKLPDVPDARPRNRLRPKM